MICVNRIEGVISLLAAHREKKGTTTGCQKKAIVVSECGLFLCIPTKVHASIRLLWKKDAILKYFYIKTINVYHRDYLELFFIQTD
jgi:hypothetical protein